MGSPGRTPSLAYSARTPDAVLLYLQGINVSCGSLSVYLAALAFCAKASSFADAGLVWLHVLWFGMPCSVMLMPHLLCFFQLESFFAGQWRTWGFGRKTTACTLSGLRLHRLQLISASQPGTFRGLAVGAPAHFRITSESLTSAERDSLGYSPSPWW